MRETRRARPRRERRTALTRAIGSEVSRFQEATHAFDEVAAAILGVERDDLACLTAILFGEGTSADGLAGAIGRPRGRIVASLRRLQVAGYVRGGPSHVGVSEHARVWVERIWAPLWREGQRVLAQYRSPELAVLASFLPRASAVQEAHTRTLRGWLAAPPEPRGAGGRLVHRRGGLSPAALRRVELFVEAHLERPIRLGDLADRAALSPYHFARAFKVSAGATPREFVEARRVDRARAMLLASDRPLAEVASACGLGSQSRFTTTFKRHVGVTPGAFRRVRDESAGVPARGDTTGRAGPQPAARRRGSAPGLRGP